MKIAVIAWGSLVWDPRDLDIEPEWREDGPLLPVEFARFSGRERLTLVLVEGVPLQHTLWTLSRQPTLAAAISDLRAREGTSLANFTAGDEGPTWRYGARWIHQSRTGYSVSSLIALSGQQSDPMTRSGSRVLQRRSSESPT